MNIWDILIIAVVIILAIIAIVNIRRNRGKCSSCGFSNNCPLKK